MDVHKKINILIPQVSYFSAICLIKLLHKIRNISVKIVGCGKFPNGMTSGSLLVNNYYHFPESNDHNQYLFFIKQLCQKEKIDIIIPSDEDELLFLETHRYELDCMLICPKKEILALLLDKYEASIAMEKLGIHTPKIITDLCNQQPQNGKVIFREKHGSGSQGIYKINLQIDHYIINKFNKKTFMQECIEGKEYTVDVLCDKDGNIKIAIPRHRLDIRAGISYKCSIKYNEEIISIVKNIYSKFYIPGFSNVQFIENENGIYFIELNPRFAGTGIASCLASFNLVELFINHFIYDIELLNFDDYMKFVAWDSIITRFYEETIYRRD